MQTRKYVAELPRLGIPPDAIETIKGHIGILDQAWNMLSLTPTLHTLWGKAYFGLKKLGIKPAPKDDMIMGIVTVQFVWLPRMAGNTIFQKLDMQSQRLENHESLISKLRNHDFSNIGMVNGTSKVPIRTGQTFEICLGYSDAEKFGQMIDVQWALLELAAMSGAADAADKGYDPSQPDAAERVRAWVSSIAEEQELLGDLEVP
jgi:hypothetical protein